MSGATSSKQPEATSAKALIGNNSSARAQAIICTSGISGPYVGGLEKTKQPGGKNAVKPAFVLDSDLGSDVDVTLVSWWARGTTSWEGFTLSFDIGEANETTGFGVRYQPSVEDPDKANLELSRQHTLVVKLPNKQEQYKITKGDISGSTDLPEPIRALAKVCWVRIDLLDGGEFSVNGFGKPFANPGHPSDDWINRNMPIIGGLDLLNLLRRRSLTFLVNKTEKSIQFGKVSMPPPFRYPFDYPFNPRKEPFKIDDFKDMIEENMGDRFRTLFVFDDDDQSASCSSLAHVMDIYWLHKASCDIRQTEVPAYFVRRNDEESADSNPNNTMYFAIIRLTETFRDQHKSQWGRLTKDGLVSLDLHGSEGVQCPGLRCVLMPRPDNVPDLENKHALQGQFEFDLVVQLPVSGDHRDALKTFEGRVEAEEAFKNSVTLNFNVNLSDLERKVKAVESFLPGAEPCPVLEDSADSSDDLEFKMTIHRDIMRGTGFFRTLTQESQPTSETPERVSETPEPVSETTESISQTLTTLPIDDAPTPPKPVRSLPQFNFFEVEDPVLKEAILEDSLPSDRARMESYGTGRHCNIALVSAPGGTGKTTALSVLTLGGLYCSGGGKVYGSGPTNTAVTNFALRAYAKGRDVAERCNKAKPASTTGPEYRAPLVVRGYSAKIELSCLQAILKTGVADDQAYKSRHSSDAPRWRLALSPANWLLAVLGSKALQESREAGAVKGLTPLDAVFLHQLREEVDALYKTDAGGAIARLILLVRGEMSWAEYCKGTMAPKELLEKLMQRIIDAADIVMTTPAGAKLDRFRAAWEKAKVIAVDEAGCMHKADLCSIWGNTLRAIIIAGDTKQLRPPMMELQNQDALGNWVNRFGLAGRISALAWLQAAGFPTFRLLQQLRMCRGMFDLANKLFYPDYPKMAYASWCDPSHEAHEIGVKFEAYIASRHLVKALTPSPEGSLLPMFLHMPNTKVYSVGSSKLNRMQVVAALELLDDFVKSSGVSPTEFVVISAHKPNVDYGNRVLKRFPRLKSMPPLQSADSFQGREGSISVVITGTKKGYSGGFVSDENRLNVMLTRQKSGLLIVGDENVTGPLEGTAKQLRDADKVAAKGKAYYEKDGEQVFSRVRALRGMLMELKSSGRIFEMFANREQEKEARELYEKQLAEEEQKLAEIERKRAEVAQTLDFLTNVWKYDESKSWADLCEEELEEVEV